MGDAAAAPGGQKGRGRGGGSRMRGGGGGKGGKGGGAPGSNGMAPTMNNGNGMASLPFQDPAIMAMGSGPPPPIGQQLFNSAVPLPVQLGSPNGAPNGIGAGPNSLQRQGQPHQPDLEHDPRAPDG